jgi:hypothetical protein
VKLLPCNATRVAANNIGKLTFDLNRKPTSQMGEGRDKFAEDREYGRTLFQVCRRQPQDVLRRPRCLFSIPVWLSCAVKFPSWPAEGHGCSLCWTIKSRCRPKHIGHRGKLPSPKSVVVPEILVPSPIWIASAGIRYFVGVVRSG